MMYDVECKSDLLSGATLVVRLPEEDLDKKALYTILEDKPDFILPFRYRVIDGQIEFTYQLGSYSKIQYLAGDRHPNEYAEIWGSVLIPLFECGDWFLRPYSFVLDINHVYSDKNKNSVGYVYIPSMKDCSNYHDLKEMAANFSRQVTVTDSVLENKVLRSIMTDFNPKTFLQMLRSGISENLHLACIPPQHREYYVQKALPMPQQIILQQDYICGEINNETHRNEHKSITSSDIIIDFHPEYKSKSSTAKSYANTSATRRRKEKNTEDKKSKTAMRKNTLSQRNNNKKTESAQHCSSVLGQESSCATDLPFSTFSAQPIITADITQSTSYEQDGAWLRLVGSTSLPPVIDVAIDEGEIFTVGRYDSAVGRQLSCFEFERTTKAISRRHAAIERFTDGYNIIDLSSSAGTFLDGQKLPPNTPCKLDAGCRVSFGNCGADYIWEQ